MGKNNNIPHGQNEREKTIAHKRKSQNTSR